MIDFYEYFRRILPVSSGTAQIFSSEKTTTTPSQIT
jgi:hypothetical protein